MVGNTSGGIFGSTNTNTSFGQSKPVGTGFSFGAPTAQPTGNIFGTTQTSTAGTGMFGASTAGTTNIYYFYSLCNYRMSLMQL